MKEIGKNTLLVIASCLFTLIFLELTIRFLHSKSHNLTFFYTIEEDIYREIANVKKHFNSKKINILLLGGSVLDSSYESLKEKFSDHPNYELYDFSMAAHSSRDSLFKYRYLTELGYKFDFVVFYHGINETRANNISPERYKADYSHYFFYSQINPVFNKENVWLRRFLKSAIAIKFYQGVFYYLFKDDKDRFVPAHDPREEWTQYGHDIKSVHSFRENLSQIITMAKQTHARLIVPWFASFLPDNYTDDAAKLNQLGYAKNENSKYLLLAKAWGKPENVKKGLAAHNQVILDFQDQFYFLDLRNFDRDNTLFVDPCHFSEKGIRSFTNQLKTTILRLKNES